MSDKTDAAYMAGIMDGEGCFSITRCLAKKKQTSGSTTENFHYSVHITVANTHRPVLDWMMGHFGGNVYTAKRMPSARCKQRYDWKLNNFKGSEKFILAILPYLRIKREQALIALEFCRFIGQRDPQKRAELRQRMLDANNSCKRPVTLTTNTPNFEALLERTAKYLVYRGNVDRTIKDGRFKPINKVTASLMIESALTGDRESAPAVTQVPTS